MKKALPILVLLFSGSFNALFAQAPVIVYPSLHSYRPGIPIQTLTPTSTGGAVQATIYKQVSTMAGSGSAGSANGTGTAASFKLPWGVATDAAGNVYVADLTNDLIRKITPAGLVTTLAGNVAGGSANGTGTAASFRAPAGVAVDAAGNVYVADQSNNLIRKITPARVVTTLAGSGAAGAVNGTGTAASFKQPVAVCVDKNGNVYVADQGNQLIRKITPAGVVTTLAGSGAVAFADGTGTAASFHSPSGLTVDAAGNVFVADLTNYRIRMITPAGEVTTFAGTGTTGHTEGWRTDATFSQPYGITIDKGHNLYITEKNGNRIRKIDSLGFVTTLAGTGSAGSTNAVGTAASFNSPLGITIDGLGNIYVADEGNNLVRKITVSGYTIDQPLPAGLSFNPLNGVISGTPTTLTPQKDYVVTAYNAGGFGSTTLTIVVAAAPVAAPAISYSGPQNYPISLAITPLSPANSGGAVPATTYGNGSELSSTGDYFYTPYATATDILGNVYVVDEGRNAIMRITPSGLSKIIAGGGTPGFKDGYFASFSTPRGLAVDSYGNVYVADQGNARIRKIAPNGWVSTLAGSGVAGAINGAGTIARFKSPYAVALDKAGNVYVADYGNNLVRKITPAGVVSTFAGSGAAGAVNGTGTTASFNTPRSVAVDTFGNVYVAEYSGNKLIRKITPAGVVTTFAGNGVAGEVDGTGTAASFNLPSGVCTDPSGNVYVTDAGSGYIRKITPAGVVTTLYGDATHHVSSAVGPAFGGGNLYAIAPTTSALIYKFTLTGYTISPALPAGLSFNSTTGVISGTPTAVSAATSYTITAYNATGVNATTVSIAVSVPPPPTVDYGAAKAYVINNPITPLTPTSSGVYPPGYSKTSVTLATGSTLNSAMRAVLDTAGNVYVINSTNHSIMKIPAGGGTPVLVSSAITSPTALAIDAAGNLYVADYSSNAIKKIPVGGGAITALPQRVNSPYCVAVDTAGNVFAGSVSDNVVLKLPAGGGAAVSIGSISDPSGLAVDKAGNVFAVDYSSYSVKKIPAGGGAPIVVISGLTGPNALALDGAGDLFVSNTSGGVFEIPANNTTPLTVETSIVASGVAVDGAGNVYVSAAGGVYKFLPAGGYFIKPSLPLGLNFDGATGTISGTPTALSPTTTYTVAAYNAGGHTTATVQIRVVSMGVNVINPRNTDLLLLAEPIVKQAFSPNGDGINDVLSIDHIESYPDNTLTVINSSGGEVYRVSGYDNVTRAFDGHSNKNGTMQISGTYFYLLEYKVNGELKRKTGFIVLKD